MKGTWVQSATGYDNGTHTPPEGGAVKETMQGVIAPDGDILITDGDGFYEGTLENGTFTGQYAETGADATAMNVTWTKK